MSILSAEWHQGRVLPGDNKGEVLQEYMCYGCAGVCRTTVLAHTPAPSDCIHPDILERNQEIGNEVDMFLPKPRS